jgi:signal peptidase I
MATFTPGDTQTGTVRGSNPDLWSRSTGSYLESTIPVFSNTSSRQADIPRKRMKMRRLFFAVCAALFFKQFIFTVYVVPSSSMEDTLLPGDYVLASRFSYNIRTFEYLPFTRVNIPFLSFRGFERIGRRDVVVFNPAIEYQQSTNNYSLVFVKRCVGLPGDTIDVPERSMNSRKDSGSLVLMSDVKLSIGFRRQEVPEGHYFMLGDNPLISSDSRQWGSVPEENIIGKVVMVLWSWSPEIPITDFWNKLCSIRWSRIGKRID